MPGPLELALIVVGFVALVLLFLLALLWAAHTADSERDDLLEVYRAELEREGRKVVELHTHAGSLSHEGSELPPGRLRSVK